MRLAILAAAFLLHTLGGVQAYEVKRHPLAHVVRITAALEFDGHAVKFDTLIDCYAGTPTSSPRMVFRKDRGEAYEHLPDGGVVGFRISRELCYLNGSEWGSSLPEKRAPEEWTPILQYFDHRDLREATYGIIYRSETALNNPNGRLRITEPFLVTIPQHPASEELIAEAKRQRETMGSWPEGEYDRNKYRAIYRHGNMDWMYRFPETVWRDPIVPIGWPKSVYRGRPPPQKDAVSSWLDSIEGSGPIVLPYPIDIGRLDARILLFMLRGGYSPDGTDLSTFGIPKPSAPRFGTLASEKLAQKWANSPTYKPNRYDDYVPFKCVDGVMVPVPETPGLQYWYRERCSRQEHHRGIDFFGKQIEGASLSLNDRLIFDRDTKDLWWVQTMR